MKFRSRIGILAVAVTTFLQVGCVPLSSRHPPPGINVSAHYGQIHILSSLASCGALLSSSYPLSSTDNTEEFADCSRKKEADTKADASNQSGHQLPLLLSDISSLRVREIKYRLSHRYGYTPQKLSRILDKTELVHLLSYEEHMAYNEQQEKQRTIDKNRRWRISIIIGIAGIGIKMLFPFIRHLYSIVAINFVVYAGKR